MPAVNINGNIVDFNGGNAIDSFNFKTKITGMIKSRNCKSRLWKQKSLNKNNKRQNGFLMPPHPLINFEIQKYYQNEPNGFVVFILEIIYRK